LAIQALMGLYAARVGARVASPRQGVLDAGADVVSADAVSIPTARGGISLSA
jgi:hypothetical protein